MLPHNLDRRDLPPRLWSLLAVGIVQISSAAGAGSAAQDAPARNTGVEQLTRVGFLHVEVGVLGVERPHDRILRSDRREKRLARDSGQRGILGLVLFEEI